MRALMIAILVLGVPAISPAQTAEQNGKARFFVVPQDTVFTTTACQPNSPIEFLRAVNLGSVDRGGGTASFRLRNRGSNTITSYTIATVSSIGTGSTWTFKANGPSEWIVPGQVFGWNDEKSFEILPLTDELRKRKELRNGLVGVAIFMVVRAVCGDGTVFDDESSYKSLVSFFENNAITAPLERK
jgi:hypothetical protein